MSLAAMVESSGSSPQWRPQSQQQQHQQDQEQQHLPQIPGQQEQHEQEHHLCQNCKASLPALDSSQRGTCPLCGTRNLHGSSDISRASSRQSRRSPHLPRLDQSLRSGQQQRRLSTVSNGDDGANNNNGSSNNNSGAIGSLLASSLGSLTLGSLGLPGGPGPNSNKGELDKLPEIVAKQTGGNTNVSTIDVPRDNSRPHSRSLQKGNYPEPLLKSRTEFKALLEEVKADQQNGQDKLADFYSKTFRTPASVCATFKSSGKRKRSKSRNRENGHTKDSKLEPLSLRLDLLYQVWDCVKSQQGSAQVQKAAIRAVVACLLDEDDQTNTILLERDRARCLFCLLHCPLFQSQQTYTILAHLLQQITRLPNTDHQHLVHWIREGNPDRTKTVIQSLLQFITIRQFPPADKSLPPLSKSRWWIPTATKVLALINAANNLKSPPMLEYSEFYNISLDHMDLMQEYYTWQNPERANQFSYCQYPFILSIVAKQHILTKDSEQQMILTARRSLVQKMARHQQPQIEIFFLNIRVRRDHLVQDSLKEISEKQRDLKKKLKISFANEPGLDMGGLTKEWFQLLIKNIFEPDNGMFVYHTNSRCYWFSLSASKHQQQATLRQYNLIGVLMGLAVYNSIILDLHFPSICYRKLLTPPVVPPGETVPVGIVTNPGLSDLSEIMPEVASSLKDTLEYKGDVQDDLVLNFQASVEEYGKVITEDLKPNGKDIAVTNDNREEFVKLYLDWLLNHSIEERFRAFYLGFHSVCASNALIMLRPEEVEQLVCGSQVFDLNELKKVTFYDGYKAEDQTIKFFWQVLEDYSGELQKRFLRFTTGSDRVPVGGTQEMSIKITKMKDKMLDHLPIAHTCFNQLGLPDYKDREILQRKLTIAISNAEGFGLE